MIDECARRADNLKRQLDELHRLERDAKYIAEHLGDLQIKVEVTVPAGTAPRLGSADRLAELVRVQLPGFVAQLVADQHEIVGETLADLNRRLCTRTMTPKAETLALFGIAAQAGEGGSA